MGKIRRGGYVFISWKLDNDRVMRGAVSAEIVELIQALRAEGRL